MARVFHFHPDNEKLDDFNARLADYCQDNDVVNLQVSCTGSGLMLSTTEPEDTGMTPPLVLLPVVYAYAPAEAKRLEQMMNAYMDEIRAQHTEENPSIPLQAQAVPRTDGQGGYILLLVCIGELDPEDALGDQGGEQGGG